MKWEKRYGPWALVTGASAGLGAEFVRQIALRGLHVALVARRIEKMNALAERVERASAVRTRVIQSDLTEAGACARVAQETNDLEIGLLVNNAGYGVAGSYHSCDPDRLVNMTVLNCVVPVLLTNHFLPLMLERGRGGVIFLASTAAYQPTPYLGAYGATKAFNLMLGESLWQEYRKQGVDSLALSPGFTKTEFQAVANMANAGGFREATPDAVVAEGLNRLGKRPSTIHGALNKLLAFSTRLLPRRAVSAITAAALKGRVISS